MHEIDSMVKSLERSQADAQGEGIPRSELDAFHDWAGERDLL